MLAARRAVAAEGHRTGRAGAPLRARASWRDDPYRHQEARPHRPVGHRITGDPRRGQSPSGVGWEFVHVCIDDASRVAFSQILPDERKESAVAFLEAAIAYYASLGVTMQRVMTDNGSCYRSKAFASLPAPRSASHLHQALYAQDQRQGRALHPDGAREWAYAIAYNTSDERAAELPRWLHRYNWHRPHGS